MRAQQGRGGLVYSTEGGRMCPVCRQALAQCRCRQQQAARAVGDGRVRVSRETQGRGGKAVTVVRGLPLDAAALATLGKQLKAACGSGGTAKGDLPDSHRARRGFCGMSRKAQNPRQAWTACLVLQRRGSPAKPRPRRGSAKNGPFAHQIACVCLRAHDARCWRSNHPVFDSNAHGGSFEHHP